MPEVSVEIEVWCNECGEGLCSESTGGSAAVYVNPCPKCMAQAEDTGDATGYDRGYADGMDDYKET
jgi:hypothetical protein